MKTRTAFAFTIGLYTLLSIVLLALFHTLIMIFIAGIATAIVGLLISLSVGGKKA